MTALLEVRNLSRAFGPMWAVRDVSFTVGAGEIVGLIGPNGAGKSTLYNLIAGALKPDLGHITLAGQRITGGRPHRAARLGIARTFQIPKPYRHLTVVENVLVGALLHERTVATARTRAEAVLADVGLAEYASAPVTRLTVGLLKRLEVARAIALMPRLVLFDEIMAGLTPPEVNVMTDLVAGLPGRGITVIWVEHILPAIMKAARRILVLNRGELIADDVPSAVARNTAVIKAYLGDEIGHA